MTATHVIAGFGERESVARSAAAREGGFILVPVILMLVVVASVSLLISLEGSMSNADSARALEAIDASYVAEAGYSDAKWRLGQTTSCTGYVNLAAVPFAQSSYDVAVSPSIGSPVTLTATGVLPSGARSVLRATAMAYQAPSTLVIQPGAAAEDTYLWDGLHKNTNFGTSPNMMLNNASAERTMLMRFDLSALPPGKILGATLELYLEGGVALQNGVLDLHRSSRSWFEGVDDDRVPTAPGATYLDYDGFSFGSHAWTSGGGDYEPTPESTLTISSLVPGFYSWDATSATTSWIDGEPNYGFLVRASGGNVDKVDFASSDGSDASRHPKLSILYACECGVDCGAGVADLPLFLSTGASAKLGGLAFSATDLVEYDPINDSAGLYLDGTAASFNSSIDALHVLANGNFVFSTREDTVIGGVAIKDGDLAEYDPVGDVVTLILEEDAVFGNDTDIQGVHVMDSGSLILSTANDSKMGGIKFTDLDLVEFDRASGEASIFFTAAGTTLDRSIDALHILENGNLVVSADNDASLGGVDFAADDLVSYNVGTESAELFFDAWNFYGNGGDITALHVGGGSGSTALPGPIAHWKLDEVSGVVAVDSEGGHDGKVDGALWDAGMIDGGLLFDGINDRVEVAHSEELSMTSALTVSAWIRNDASPMSGTYRILSKETSGADDNFFLSLQSARLWMGIGGVFFSPGTIFDAGVWYHVAGSFDANAGEIRMYVNGVEELAQVTTAILTPNSAPVSIGANWETSKYWDGILDDVRLYNRALGLAEIEALATGGGGGGGNTGCDGTFRDEFNSQTYSGNDGTLSWAGDWQEVNESNGATMGDEKVAEDTSSSPRMDTNQLRVRDNDGGGEGVMRALSLEGAASAVLSFNYRPFGFDNADDHVSVAISHTGTGGPWEKVAIFEGPLSSSAYAGFKADISDHISDDVVLRILTSKVLDAQEYLWLDNIQIQCKP